MALVVLNWNGWRDTQSCLDSLREVQDPALFVVVVDNGSTDGSDRKIRSWMHGKSQFTFIRNDRNLGFSAGNNVGIREALHRDFPFIGLLNNDTRVEPGFLAPLVQSLHRHADWIAVAPKILQMDRPERLWYAGSTERMWRAGLDHAGLNQPDGPEWSGERQTDHVCGCCFVARRTLFDDIGLLDEDYFFFGEDWALSRAARAKGHNLGVNLDSKIYHRAGGSYDKRSPRAAYFDLKNRLLTLKKHGSRLERLTGYGFYALSRPVRFAQWLREGKRDFILAESEAIRDFLLGRFGAYDLHRANPTTTAT